MECVKHGLMPTAEKDIYQCIECKSEFQVSPATPRCQLCGERKGVGKVFSSIVDGSVHAKCSEDFSDTARELEMDLTQRAAFAEKKKRRWMEKLGL
jgi:hypothetical protein